MIGAFDKIVRKTRSIPPLVSFQLHLSKLLSEGVISSFYYLEMSRIPFDTIWLELANAERMYVFVRERERESGWWERDRGGWSRDSRVDRVLLRSIKGSQVYAFVGTHA